MPNFDERLRACPCPHSQYKHVAPPPCSTVYCPNDASTRKGSRGVRGVLPTSNCGGIRAVHPHDSQTQNGSECLAESLSSSSSSLYPHSLTSTRSLRSNGPPQATLKPLLKQLKYYEQQEQFRKTPYFAIWSNI